MAQHWLLRMGRLVTSDRLAFMAHKYGPLAAIAIFLVWWMATDVQGKLERLEETLARHQTETAYFLRAICVNEADSSQKLANCQEPRR